jgi:thioredoxin reductase
LARRTQLKTIEKQERSMNKDNLPVAVIGAGPVGLAAAAELILRGETPLVLEAGQGPGASIREWAHVSMFSPWEFNTSKAAVALLAAAGWEHPKAEAIPTGRDYVELYLEPLAGLPALRPHIRYGARVTGVSRRGHDKVRTQGRAEEPFVLQITTADGAEQVIEARAVIDASGTWTSPNPAGADGLPAPGERAAADRLYYGIPDVLGTLRDRYADKTIVVVGGGHSAINALIELGTLKRDFPATRILWVMRKAHIEAAYGGESADALPARGALGIQARDLVERGAVEVLSPFRIARIARAADGSLLVTGDHGGRERELPADEMIVATGFRPDLSLLREIRLTLDPWLESSGEIGPLIDPNEHSCGTVRPHGAKELAHAEPGFFIIGMKSYGRAPTFLTATGHEQARSVVAHLAGDHDAAVRVELELPETGVCFSRPIGQNAEAASCCNPAPAGSDACCDADALAKEAGEARCGCPPPKPVLVTAGGACCSR